VIKIGGCLVFVSGLIALLGDLRETAMSVKTEMVLELLNLLGLSTWSQGALVDESATKD
jgi:hypothetical protein